MADHLAASLLTSTPPIAKRIGLFFGSFNPIHIGHLIIASQVVELSSCDQVWFVVSPQNPFKQKSSLLDQRQRLHMVRLAIGDDDRLRASDVEFGLPVPSYTVDTLAYLGEKHPQHRFDLIMGSDNLQSFPKWKHADKILEEHQLLVYPRPGQEDAALRSHPSVEWLSEMPLLQLSATKIRKSIREGQNVRYMLPDPVFAYLDETGFYQH
jgi:nicotinate-nucleotide adenylyltransferase